jgi:hypothetical protein
MKVHTSGIFVTSARHEMWCVKIGEQLFASSSIKRLQKKLTDPEAKVGCFASITYIILNGINRKKQATFKGFIDFETGEWAEGSASPGPRSLHTYKVPDNYQGKHNKEAIDAAVAHMIEKWQEKFRKEAKL